MSAPRPWLERSLSPRPLIERRPGTGRIPHELLSRPTGALRAPAERAAGASRQRLSPGAARLSAGVGLLAAVALPVVLWSHDIGTVASSFRVSPGYLVTGWGAYALIVWGLALLAGAVLGGRLDGPRRRAWSTWGISLYLLGMVLASQVSAFLR